MRLTPGTSAHIFFQFTHWTIKLFVHFDYEKLTKNSFSPQLRVSTITKRPSTSQRTQSKRKKLRVRRKVAWPAGDWLCTYQVLSPSSYWSCQSLGHGGQGTMPMNVTRSDMPLLVRHRRLAPKETLEGPSWRCGRIQGLWLTTERRGPCCSWKAVLCFE